MKMRSYDDYDEYDEYGSGGYQKNHKKKNKENYRSGKGHQSRHKANDCWIELEDTLDFGTLEAEIVAQPVTVVSPTPAPAPVIQPPHIEAAKSQDNIGPLNLMVGPNTHTIKGNIIDFERVANIEKVENEHNGILTYGIKFLFVGKKGLSRIAWFNKNIKERDSVYDKEYVFWQSMSTNKTI